MVKRERLYDVKVVTVGGGTGSSTLLRGLKLFTEYITAVVTVADDGGGSGMLREELGMLPPGDARNCLFALANAEPAFAQVFDYRFKEGSLKGQSLGNLFVAALNDIYGGFDLGLKEAGNILAITGQVLPMTLEDVKLCARLKNGDIIKGESVLPKEVLRIGSPIETLFLEPEFSHSIPETLKAIEEADLILLGPGSLYTSLIPNLLVEDLAGAVLVGNNSTLALNLTEGSTFEGYVDGNIVNAANQTVSTEVGTVTVTLDTNSTWTLTADSHVTEFTGTAANVIANGHTLYVNSTALTGTN